MKIGGVCIKHPELEGKRHNGGNCPLCTQAKRNGGTGLQPKVIKTEEEKKEERRLYQKQYLIDNKQMVSDKAKAYRLANLELFTSREKRWVEENPDAVKKTAADYRLRNRDAINAKVKALKLESPEYLEKCRATGREWAAKNPEAGKKAGLKKVGYTLELYKSTIKKQNYLCAVCTLDLRTLEKGKPNADHCHTEMKPRGILCHACNVGLGFFKDNIETLQAAIDYLKKHQ